MTDSSEESAPSAAPMAEPVDQPPVQQGTGPTAVPYVYAIGRIEPRFPSLALEKEFAQVAGRGSDNAGLTDAEALQSVLADKANRYLVRRLCFVMTVQGLDTYILAPRDPADVELLVDALRPTPRPTDIDVVIGVRGPIAPPETCNGLTVPIVVFDQLYSFDVSSLIEDIPAPEGIPENEEQQFRATAEEVFYRMMQVTENAGATDEHRALNYLAVRYPMIYERTARAHQDNASLSEVSVRPSYLSGARNIVEVIFAYMDRRTGVVEKSFVRVDVTEEFPFLVTGLGAYYDR